VDGFEAVAVGGKVDVKRVTPGVVAKAQKVIAEHPSIRAILLECTELPPYEDALRKATGLPVYSAITGCNFFMTGFLDNKRFGKQGWQKHWDGVQETYKYAMNLTADQKAKLVNKVKTEAKQNNSGKTAAEVRDAKGA